MEGKRSGNRKSSDMYPIVEAYMSSSMNRAEFCEAYNLPISALNYWHRKYRASQGILLKKAEGNFVAVEVSAPTSSSVVMELVLGNGSRLCFYSYPEARYLQSLLSIGRC